MRLRFLIVLLFAATLATAQPMGKLTIAWYNVENLYDTLDNPATNDAEFLPTGDNQWTNARYQAKLTSLARVIDSLGGAGGPDILGFGEIENRLVLNDLVAHPKLKDRNYSVVHFDSPDERGIDVGFIYKPSRFVLLGARPYKVDLRGDKTRDVVLVQLKAGADTLHVLLNHWPSRREGAAQSAWKRAEAAKVARACVDSLLERNANAKILLMGDFNDEPEDSSIVHVLRARWPKEKLAAGDLFNTVGEMSSKDQGTYQYRGSWDMIDQIIVSRGLIYGPGITYIPNSAGIYKQPYLLETAGKFAGSPLRTFAGKKYLGGYSDHLPLFAKFNNPPAKKSLKPAKSGKAQPRKPAAR